MPHILTLTGLYPSSARPRHGVFVEERLHHLLGTGGITATVFAPVPWFPFTSSYFGEYGRLARTPRTGIRRNVEVSYPRYLSIPKIGMEEVNHLGNFQCVPTRRPADLQLGCY